jgi:transposase-like protein
MSQDDTSRPTHGVTPTGGVPDPEVVAQATRRRFSAEYKLRILAEVERCTQPGEIGALLRREGLYSSHLSKWRQQQLRGQLQGLTAQQRGRKAGAQAAGAAELAALRRENERLQARLQQAETIIEVQKKVSELLGLAPTVLDGRS